MPGPQLQEADGERVVVAIAAGQSGQVAQQCDRKVVVAGLLGRDEVLGLPPGGFALAAR